jgi:alpha-mannosidase
VPLSITEVESTELFVGAAEQPRQVVRVHLTGVTGTTTVRVAGGASGSSEVRPSPTAGPVSVVEVALEATAQPGTTLALTVTADDGTHESTMDAEVVVAEPGWTLHMVSHFHYDPVWWNTQAAYTSEWDRLDWEGSPRGAIQRTGFDLVRVHTALARRDPDYRFVLAEVDYLKPYWDMYPEDRAYLRQLLAQGRLELIGGTYNEPNTNLTSAETTARNAVYGIGFQRDIVGGDPATAWQLDAFGHDPQFPGMMADAGLTSSSWARGPFHQWGPMMSTFNDAPSDPGDMQFTSEFEWISPSGSGLLTAYMPAHYSAGWFMDSAPTLQDAEEAVYQLFRKLASVAATRHVLLPVGTDYSPPNRWVTDIHRDWNARYVSPRFVCSLPRDFFAGVRQELARRRGQASPQTRDMNPIYTGKDVSYIDTKQAQREAETLLVDAEKWATIASLAGAGYPSAAVDKAWRLLVYGAHHDAITGSESDQVYIDLVAGFREALELARDVHTRATSFLAGAAERRGAGTPVTVFNALSWDRTDLVRVTASFPPGTPAGLRIVTDDGTDVPFVAEDLDHRDDGSLRSATLTFVALDVPSVGYRTWWLRPAPDLPSGSRWTRSAGTRITNDALDVAVDPARGGGITRLIHRHSGRSLLTDGHVGNELVVYEEYPEHPRFREGPWHLVPKGPSVGSAGAPAAEVHVERSSLGERLVVTGTVGPARYTQVLTLVHGVPRLDCVTHLDEWAGSDQLVRVRFPCRTDGALPVSEVGNAVVGRGFAFPDVDSLLYPWTLDNPAYNWFALSSTARVVLRDGVGQVLGRRALGIADVVVGHESQAGPLGRDLVVALARVGVTSTTSTAAGPRYGLLATDSNLPDFRVAIGGPTDNAFTADALALAGQEYADEVTRQLKERGRARVWLPAQLELAEVWQPGADLRATGALPVLVVAGRDDEALRQELDALVEDLQDAEIDVQQAIPVPVPAFDDWTTGLLNRGMPGFAVDTSGALHLSLLRSCTGWPSGVWIDPPRRTVPDGSGFQLQHWTHSFEYSLVAGAGDWRAAGLVHHGHQVNHPLTAIVGAAGEGRLPATASLLALESADGAQAPVLAALKPTGNPIASGRGEPASAVAGVTLRVYEPAGRTVPLHLGGLVRFTETSVGNLIEEPITPIGPVAPLLGAQITTVLARPVPLAGPGPDEAIEVLGPRTDPATPAYARYWLHNRGPAPMGGHLVAVHLKPAGDTSVAQPGTPLAMSLSVASSLTEAAARGVATITVPQGWRVEPATVSYDLVPGGHAASPVTLVPASDAVPGRYAVAAALTDPHGGATEDVVVLTIGEASADPLLEATPPLEADPLLDVRIEQESIEVAAGDSVVVHALVRNHAHSPVRGELQLISPYGTWDALGPWSQGFEVPADGTARIPLRIAPDRTARPGRWWFLAKVMAFGHVSYTAASSLEVVAR